MNFTFNLIFSTLILISLPLVGNGQDSSTTKQKELLNTINIFSGTTAPQGKGAEAYGNFLADDFSRWTIGSAFISNKNKWVEGVKDWFDDGWRVSDRDQQFIEILILNDYAHTRRIVTETYLGPNGESSVSKAALAEVWVFRNDSWLLFRVNILPMANN